MNRQPELVSLIITSRIGFFIHNPVSRDPNRVDWVIQGITSRHRDKILSMLCTFDQFYMIKNTANLEIEILLVTEGFTKNPEWQSGYPPNFTWYDEHQDIIYEHCTLPTTSFIRGDVEAMNQCRDFEPLSDALNLNEYLKGVKKRYENRNNQGVNPDKLLQLPVSYC